MYQNNFVEQIQIIRYSNKSVLAYLIIYFSLFYI